MLEHFTTLVRRSSSARENRSWEPSFSWKVCSEPVGGTRVHSWYLETRDLLRPSISTFFFDGCGAVKPNSNQGVTATNQIASWLIAQTYLQNWLIFSHHRSNFGTSTTLRQSIDNPRASGLLICLMRWLDIGPNKWSAWRSRKAAPRQIADRVADFPCHIKTDACTLSTLPLTMDCNFPYAKAQSKHKLTVDQRHLQTSIASLLGFGIHK